MGGTAVGVVGVGPTAFGAVDGGAVTGVVVAGAAALGGAVVGVVPFGDVTSVSFADLSRQSRTIATSTWRFFARSSALILPPAKRCIATICAHVSC